MFRMFGSGVSRQGGDGQNTTKDGRSVHLALYKYDSCPYCQRVFRAIDEAGVNVEYRDVQMDRDHARALRSTTGRTTVPCLFIDGEPMFESSEIAYWLREQFAG
ncbi:MAG: glutaredoxin [Deltaproteobacteria bacterium]|nr:MAG: glutaredoxin [Deltaproteobacteria bacterium]